MAGLWFVLLVLLIYIVFFGLPFLATIGLSFTDWHGLGRPDFTGMANYSRLAGVGAMRSALGNNMIWVALGTAMLVIVGLILAVIFWSDARGSIAYRTIFFLPVILSLVVIGVIWGWIYNPLFGLLNTGLRKIGPGGWAMGWLGESETALYAVLLTAIWSYFGFCIDVLFVGLHKVNPELIEPARIDGESAPQRFRHVIVPQIASVLTMVIIAVPMVIGVVVLSALAGYGIARFRFPGRVLAFGVILLGLTIPFLSVMILPFYQLLQMGLLGSYWVVILPGIALGLPFGVFLMAAFFEDLPKELHEAARVDGCSELRIFWSVMLPLAKPAVGTLIVFKFMRTWNEFLMPLLYLQDEAKRPIPPGLMFFQGTYAKDIGLIAAGVTLATEPVIIVYLLFQRQFMRGLTAAR